MFLYRLKQTFKLPFKALAQEWLGLPVHTQYRATCHLPVASSYPCSQHQDSFQCFASKKPSPKLWLCKCLPRLCTGLSKPTPWQAVQQHDCFSDSSLSGAGTLDRSDIQPPEVSMPATITHTHKPQPDMKWYTIKHITVPVKKCMQINPLVLLHFTFYSKSDIPTSVLRVF